MGYNKLSVIIKAKDYNKGSNTTLTVSTDVASTTLTLAKEVETYLVVLDAGDSNWVKFTAGYYPEIQSIKIYGGEITDPEPFAFNMSNESGDAEYRLIEGITPDKFYTVTGLNAGAPYLYRVKAYYVNGTESLWSNTREVILAAATDVRGDVDNNGIVNITDVSALVDLLLTGEAAGTTADCNQDGNVDISDISVLIDYLMTGNLTFAITYS